MKKMGKVYVFGATGYIGRYLCVDLKERGFDFLAIGRSSKVEEFFHENAIPFMKYDIQQNGEFDETVQLFPNDVIVNLAACLAEHETPIVNLFDVNVIGTYKLLELARRHGIRKYILTTSHKVYNDVANSDGHAISEEEPPQYRGDHTPYIISKIAAENFVNYYNSDFDMDGICLRLTGVHGYGEILGHLDTNGHYRKSAWDIFFERSLNGDPIEVWGNQAIKRDHIYIKDVVSAIEAAIVANGVRGTFNIASGVGYSQYEEACALAAVFAVHKVSSVTCKPDFPGLSRGYVYDISKARMYLKWAPRYVDLTKMYEDYKTEWQRKRFRNYHRIIASEAPKNI